MIYLLDISYKVNMKYKVAILLILVLVPFVFSACTTGMPNGQKTEASGNEGNGQVTEPANSDNSISKPGFFNDIGKTLNMLKNEHPKIGIVVRNDGLPDAAAVCFGEPEGEYLYFFFGAHDGSLEFMHEYGDQLKCAGFITTAGVLFPEMEDNITFSDFFSLIDVSDYEYGTEDDSMQGWLRFAYNDMYVLIDTNGTDPDGGRNFIGAEKINSSAPAIISDGEIEGQNFDLADAVMFD